MEALLVLDRGKVPDRLQQPPVIEPGDPFQDGEFDILDPAPGTASPDDLGLEETDHRLGQGVVIRIPHAADRRLDPGFGQTLRVPDA